MTYLFFSCGRSHTARNNRLFESILARTFANNCAFVVGETVPSFDINSEVDDQEVRNAVDQAMRELGTRFDFRGVDAKFEYKDDVIVVLAEEDFQLVQLHDMLVGKLVKRGVDARSLDQQEPESSGKQRRQRYLLKQGIDKDQAKKITKMVKEAKLKVQTQIQGDQIRVTGKKRDDLQAVMALLKESDLDIPLNYDNFRD